MDIPAPGLLRAMFPHISTLYSVSERPEGIKATGRTSGYGRWMVTEFEKGDVMYYKHQKFNYNSKTNFFEERWYSECSDE